MTAPDPLAQTHQERADLTARLASLNDELADIDERRAAIKGQIEKAQADQQSTGKYADPDWFRRAKGALRHLGVERSDVCREIGEGNRRLRELNGSLNRNTFYLAVRDVVDDVTWERVLARHNELKTEADA
jgi:chromosome segregation ATPase